MSIQVKLVEEEIAILKGKITSMFGGGFPLVHVYLDEVMKILKGEEENDRREELQQSTAELGIDSSGDTEPANEASGGNIESKGTNEQTGSGDIDADKAVPDDG